MSPHHIFEQIFDAVRADSRRNGDSPMNNMASSGETGRGAPDPLASLQEAAPDPVTRSRVNWLMDQARSALHDAAQLELRVKELRDFGEWAAAAARREASDPTPVGGTPQVPDAEPVRAPEAGGRPASAGLATVQMRPLAGPEGEWEPKGGGRS